MFMPAVLIGIGPLPFHPHAALLYWVTVAVLLSSAYHVSTPVCGSTPAHDLITHASTGCPMSVLVMPPSPVITKFCPVGVFPNVKILFFVVAALPPKEMLKSFFLTTAKLTSASIP